MNMEMTKSARVLQVIMSHIYYGGAYFERILQSLCPAGFSHMLTHS